MVQMIALMKKASQDNNGVLDGITDRYRTIVLLLGENYDEFKEIAERPDP
jgi:hypothetical protein